MLNTIQYIFVCVINDSPPHFTLNYIYSFQLYLLAPINMENGGNVRLSMGEMVNEGQNGSIYKPA